MHYHKGTTVVLRSPIFWLSLPIIFMYLFYFMSMRKGANLGSKSRWELAGGTCWGREGSWHENENF